jgi:tetratricopeptide (TPR) repeat protein
MVLRLLLLAAVAAPLFAQDDDVSKYIDQLRVTKTPHDVHAEAEEQLILLRQRVDETTDPALKADLYLRISENQQVLRNTDGAIAAARTAHELVPGDQKTSQALAEVLMASGHTAELATLLDVNPADGAALLQKAKTLGESEVAKYFAQRAHDLLPGDPTAADTLGMIYMRLGNAQRAQDAFRDALAVAPQVATYHYHLGQAIMQAGAPDDALAELQLALAFNPTDVERSNIENAIGRLNLPQTKKQ